MAKPKVIGGANLPVDEEPDDGYITIQLFKDSDKYKDDVFVAVNGKGYQIQRGVPVRVPMSVAYVLEQSAEQDRKTAILIEQEKNNYRELQGRM